MSGSDSKPRNAAGLTASWRACRWAAVIAAGGAFTGLVSAVAAGGAGSVPAIFVADTGSHAVTEIAGSSGVAGRTISLGSLSPVALAIAPGERTVYVVVDGSDEDGSPGSLVPIAASTGRAGTPIHAGTASQAVSITPDGKKAFVLNGIDAATTSEAAQATVTPIDLATDRPLAPILVGTLPESMTMSPNGKLLYVVDTNQTDPGEPTAITPVDTATDRAGAEIRLSRASVPFPAAGVAFAPDNRTAYAITAAGVVPIDTANGAVGKPIGLRTADPVAVAVTPDGSSVVEVGTPITALEAGSAYGDNVTLAVASSTTGIPRAVAKLGNEPGAIAWRLAIAPDGSTAYVLVSESPPRTSALVPVDLETGAVGKSIDVGRNADAIAIGANGSTVYVLDGGTYVGPGAAHNVPGSLLPIAAATGALGKAIAVGLAPMALALASG